ncbi:hypothetical protein V1478_015811 [Vespula squamosa]|uniref:Uncharacterized protein n=1 Tax=Vespula squamosa TaxID=30214 RepID=A0ABD2A1X3_VESSQ
MLISLKIVPVKLLINNSLKGNKNHILPLLTHGVRKDAWVARLDVVYPCQARISSIYYCARKPVATVPADKATQDSWENDPHCTLIAPRLTPTRSSGNSAAAVIAVTLLVCDLFQNTGLTGLCCKIGCNH